MFKNDVMTQVVHARVTRPFLLPPPPSKGSATPDYFGSLFQDVPTASSIKACCFAICLSRDFVAADSLPLMTLSMLGQAVLSKGAWGPILVSPVFPCLVRDSSGKMAIKEVFRLLSYLEELVSSSSGSLSHSISRL